MSVIAFPRERVSGRVLAMQCEIIPFQQEATPHPAKPPLTMVQVWIAMAALCFVMWEAHCNGRV